MIGGHSPEVIFAGTGGHQNLNLTRNHSQILETEGLPVRVYPTAPCGVGRRALSCSPEQCEDFRERDGENPFEGERGRAVVEIHPAVKCCAHTFQKTGDRLDLSRWGVGRRGRVEGGKLGRLCGRHTTAKTEFESVKRTLKQQNAGWTHSLPRRP